MADRCFGHAKQSAEALTKEDLRDVVMRELGVSKLSFDNG